MQEIGEKSVGISTKKVLQWILWARYASKPAGGPSSRPAKKTARHTGTGTSVVPIGVTRSVIRGALTRERPVFPEAPSFTPEGSGRRFISHRCEGRENACFHWSEKILMGPRFHPSYSGRGIARRRKNTSRSWHPVRRRFEQYWAAGIFGKDVV